MNKNTFFNCHRVIRMLNTTIPEMDVIGLIISSYEWTIKKYTVDESQLAMSSGQASASTCYTFSLVSTFFPQKQSSSQKPHDIVGITFFDSHNQNSNFKLTALTMHACAI